MDSCYSTHRRIPKQERGARRVAQLLEASDSEFAEVGYDAATMRGIAKRAGASIGAIYQYFPNKEAVGSALRTRYVNEMEVEWTELEQATAGLSVGKRIETFVDAMIRFMDGHPACIAILDAPKNSKRNKKTSDRIRMRIANLFRARRPAVSQEEAYRVAFVTLQLIKTMNALYAEAKPQERLEIVKEYKFALVAYLEKRWLNLEKQ